MWIFAGNRRCGICEQFSVLGIVLSVVLQSIDSWGDMMLWYVIMWVFSYIAKTAPAIPKITIFTGAWNHQRLFCWQSALLSQKEGIRTAAPENPRIFSRDPAVRMESSTRSGNTNLMTAVHFCEISWRGVGLCHWLFTPQTRSQSIFFFCYTCIASLA